MNLKALTICVVGCLAGSAFGVDARAATEPKSAFKDRRDQQSYAIGAQTARNLKKDSIDINTEMLISGLRDVLNGKPLKMSEQDISLVMTSVQQEMRKNRVMNRRAEGERNKEESAKFLAENGKKPGVVTTPTGLQYTILKTGDGPKPEPADTVAVNYRGTLLDGTTEFDASQPGKPAEFVAAQTVAGFKEALTLMPVGSKWHVVIPWNLAYGDRGAGQKIGPNQTLQFDIELVGIARKGGAESKAPAPATEPAKQ